MSNNLKKKTKFRKWFNDDNIFYYLMIAWPVFQFAVFYIATRFNAIMYSFQEYSLYNNTVKWSFEPIKTAFKMMTQDYTLRTAMENSLKSFVICTVIGMTLALLFSYYISKKFRGAGVFRVLLFLPSIISSIVIVTIFMFFVDEFIPALSQELFHTEMKGLLENKDTRFGCVMFYNIFMSFGVNVLMYSNAMSGISPEIVESAQLDGASRIREFISISLPLIFPTITTFLITGVAAIFTNQYSLFAFYGDGFEPLLVNYGQWLYVTSKNASGRAEYSTVSAIGLLLTCIVLPVTLFVKWALEKFGPSVD